MASTKSWLPLASVVFAVTICASAQAVQQPHTHDKPAALKTGKSAPKSPVIVDSRAMVEAVEDTVVEILTDAADEHFHKGEYHHLINLQRVNVSARPNMTDQWANIAYYSWSLDLDDEAVSTLEEAIKKNPKTYFMYDELGQYYFMRKKDWEKAVKYLEKAATFPDHSWQTLHILARAYEKGGKLKEAVRVWEECVKDPKDAAAKVNLDRVKKKVAASG